MGNKMMILKSIIMATIVIIIGTGLPLLGWGITELASFFENPVRLAFIIVIIIQGFLIGIISAKGRTKNALSKGKRESYNKIQHLVPVINRLITLFIFFFASYCDKNDLLAFHDNYAARITGIFLYMFGTFLTAVAHNILGRQHSIEVTIQKDHKLIQKGAYRYVRNPMYTGMILSVLGYGLMFRSVISMASVIIIIALFIWRIFAEEKVLEKEFGGEWSGYAQKTWRLMPIIF